MGAQKFEKINYTDDFFLATDSVFSTLWRLNFVAGSFHKVEKTESVKKSPPNLKKHFKDRLRVFHFMPP